MVCYSDRLCQLKYYAPPYLHGSMLFGAGLATERKTSRCQVFLWNWHLGVRNWQLQVSEDPNWPLAVSQNIILKNKISV